MATMPKKQLTYFRTMRLKSGLIQTDVAALIGTSASQISRIEGNHCIPTAQQLLALVLIYDAHGSDLMAGHTLTLARTISQRATQRSGVVERDIVARHAVSRVTHMRSIRRRLTNLP